MANGNTSSQKCESPLSTRDNTHGNTTKKHMFSIEHILGLDNNSVSDVRFAIDDERPILRPQPVSLNSCEYRYMD